MMQSEELRNQLAGVVARRQELEAVVATSRQELSTLYSLTDPGCVVYRLTQVIVHTGNAQGSWLFTFPQLLSFSHPKHM